MFIKNLSVENLRNLERVDIHPHPGFNVVFGANGAGKTSLLEAVVVLSRGRSFRTTQASELIGDSGPMFRVFSEVVDDDLSESKLGLERSKKHWRARKDGHDLTQLSQLTRVLPLVLMEPNSHLLVSGAPEVRRKYLDWGMFHVEHDFLETYRRFSKILKQRNAALRSGRVDVLDSIDEVYCQAGDRLDAMRKTHCAGLSGRVKVLLGQLSPEMQGFRLEYSQGWSRHTLRKNLQESRDGDLVRGVTSMGPHRADISLMINETPARHLLSRGEQKTLSAALLLSQAELLTGGGRRPLVLLDDLASEFDKTHFSNVLDKALEVGSQVWLTGVSRSEHQTEHKVFHVERGAVQEMV